MDGRSGHIVTADRSLKDAEQRTQAKIKALNIQIEGLFVTNVEVESVLGEKQFKQVEFNAQDLKHLDVTNLLELSPAALAEGIRNMYRRCGQGIPDIVLNIANLYEITAVLTKCVIDVIASTEQRNAILYKMLQFIKSRGSYGSKAGRKTSGSTLAAFMAD